MPLTPTLIGHFSQGDVQAVSRQNRLPVDATTPDTLLVVTTTVTTDTNRDLLGSTDIETYTLNNCGQYRKLIWFYFRTGGATTTYRVLARVIDENGTPLGTGWQQLGLSTLPGGANTWGRLEIPFDTEGFYDQYRIEVWRTSGEDYTLRSKLIGVL